MITPTLIAPKYCIDISPPGELKYLKYCATLAINHKQSVRTLTQTISFQTIVKPENPAMDVIFVHGLKGDPKETWGSDENFWPSWLADDNDNLAIHTFGYSASWLKKWAARELDIFELAKAATEYLCANDIGKRPIIFVAHSLGGILTKLILLHCNEATDSGAAAIAKRTVKVMFLATPHTAPSLAAVAKKVVHRISSSHVTLLSGETSILNHINEGYRKYQEQRPELSTVAYYEALNLAGIVPVVTREQADPGITGTVPIGIPADHFEICKPKSKSDLIYVSVNRHIVSAVATAIKNPELYDRKSCFEDDGFDIKSDHDRRDLFEKMKAANREHEYAYANRQQNSFARKYTYLSLLPSTRDDYSLMLGEVEQRFQSQVYFPHICKGSGESEIRKAVQIEVVEPLSNTTIGRTKFSATRIQSAIYYLTEQCHIRWDAE